jgi:transcriptional regulator with XRE-family HTH domain
VSRNGGERSRTSGEPVESTVLGAVIRALRELAGLSQAELGKRMNYSGGLISAVELGNKPASDELITALESHLDGRGLLQKLRPVTFTGGARATGDFTDLEAKACRIHDWEPLVFPGLLQTKSYARLVISCFKPTAEESVIAADVDTRLERQNILSGDEPATAWFIIDESVLYRSFGDVQAMEEQMEHLENAAAKPNIFIQVLPFSASNHPGMEGPLRIIYFPDSRPAWYTEGWSVGRMSDSAAETDKAITNFDLIRTSALSPAESLRLIRDVRQERYGRERQPGQRPGLAQVILFRRVNAELRRGRHRQRSGPGARLQVPADRSPAFRPCRVVAVPYPPLDSPTDLSVRLAWNSEVSRSGQGRCPVIRTAQ